MAKKPVKYSVVDAFTDSAFKGNPAAVCLLEEDRDDHWLQAVASEFQSLLSAMRRAFVRETEDGDGLILQVQDPFRRLLLHGVCEFYNLVSVTVTESENGEAIKVTKITKKKGRSIELPNITLSHFLKMSKQGMW